MLYMIFYTKYMLFLCYLSHYWLIRYIYYLWKKFRFKKRRDHKKKSYDRRAYESIDDRSHS